MRKERLREDNHYLVQSYLGSFASLPKKIFVYRKLVSHPNARLWDKKSIRSAAYYKHLYTRWVEGRETGEIETWMAQACEAPATGALEKALSNARMGRQDWID